MKSPTYYRVRKFVRAFFWLAMLTAIYYVATRFWWDGSGWCVGTIEKCGL
jgi:hypothetical protein